MNSPHLSIVIVTKNRALDLVHCLGSLASQSVKPDELIIVDNASSDTTKMVVQSFRKTVKFPVRLVLETKRGYPTIYNRGLREAQFEWVAFIDDDCVPSLHWIKELKSLVSAHPQAAAIVGTTMPYNPQNIYSLATHIFQSEWRHNNSLGAKIINLEIMDNKNIVYNATFLKANNLSYDEQRIVHLNGAGEDSDLGRQIQSHKGRAYISPTALARHKESETFFQYWSRYILSLAAYEWYKTKWTQPPSHLKRRVHFRLFALKVAQNYHYAFFQKVQLYILLYSTVLFSKIFSLLMMLPGGRMRLIQWAEHTFIR
jgi:glycosyltransferase involved in cell wall biosynthesis